MGSRYALAVLVPVALLVAAFFTLFEPQRVEEERGWEQEAYRDPLLAARHFLQRVGEQAESREQLTLQTDFPAGGTVYVSEADSVLTASQADRLTGWMAEGGHLILAVTADEEHNPLLDTFGVEVFAATCDCETQAEAETEAAPPPVADSAGPTADSDAGEEAADTSLSEALRKYNRELQENGSGTSAAVEIQPPENNADLTRLAFDGVDRELVLDLGTHTDLYHPALFVDEDEDASEDAAPMENWGYAYAPFYYAGSRHGVHFMQFQVGQGMLTLLGGSDPFDNAAIGDHDHAYLLWLLSRDSSAVLLLHGSRSPGLWRLLWQHLPEAVVAALALLLAALWAVGRRFGPVIEAPESERRGIEEHLRSSANYLWQQGDSTRLLQPLADALRERASRRIPHFATLDSVAQVEALGRLSGLPERDIEQALSAAADTSPDDFAARVRVLKTLGETL
ncbi:MAG: DUF4350 domain-containing protein [Parahaliea sp.]